MAQLNDFYLEAVNVEDVVYKRIGVGGEYPDVETAIAAGHYDLLILEGTPSTINSTINLDAGQRLNIVGLGKDKSVINLNTSLLIQPSTNFIQVPADGTFVRDETFDGYWMGFSGNTDLTTIWNVGDFLIYGGSAFNGVYRITEITSTWVSLDRVYNDSPVSGNGSDWATFGVCEFNAEHVGFIGGGLLTRGQNTVGNQAGTSTSLYDVQLTEELGINHDSDDAPMYIERVTSVDDSAWVYLPKGSTAIGCNFSNVYVESNGANGGWTEDATLMNCFIGHDDGGDWASPSTTFHGCTFGFDVSASNIHTSSGVSRLYGCNDINGEYTQPVAPAAYIDATGAVEIPSNGGLFLGKANTVFSYPNIEFGAKIIIVGWNGGIFTFDFGSVIAFQGDPNHWSKNAVRMANGDGDTVELIYLGDWFVTSTIGDITLSDPA